MTNSMTEKKTNGPASGRTHNPTNPSKPLRAALVALLLGLGLSTPAQAGPPPPAGRFGGPDSILDLFQDLYWRWADGNLTLPTDRNTNAVVGPVVMMAVPSAPGDGTPGTQDVTLNAGQSWMLPLWVLQGTSYTDGTPPDPFVDVSIFKTLAIKFTIDGKTVVSARNVMDYFSKFRFISPIPINSPPTDSVIWFEGVGVLHEALSPGKHTLKLDVKNTQLLPPGFGGGVVEFHNTWNVTVKRGR
jgi:hypothetical protein